VGGGGTWEICVFGSQISKYYLRMADVKSSGKKWVI
jgi:hypothetical protein